MKKISVQNGRYYYPLRSYSLMRVCAFEQFYSYFQNLPGGAVALDYGAGDKPYEELLQTKYKRYMAADYAVTHSQYTTSSPPDIILDGGRIALDDESVDCVVLTEVLEHIYEPKRLLADLNRILKPGGYLLGTVPFAIQQHEEPYDFHRYTYFCLKKMFEENGFSVQNLDYIGDMVAVWISNTTTLFDAVPKALTKAKLGIIAAPLRYIMKIPSYLYFRVRKGRLSPGRIAYFKKYPMSFGFCVRKVGANL